MLNLVEARIVVMAQLYWRIQQGPNFGRIWIQYYRLPRQPLLLLDAPIAGQVEDQHEDQQRPTTPSCATQSSIFPLDHLE